MQNRSDDPSRRYAIDPRDHLSLLKRVRGTPTAVVGAYHSHPKGQPVPSETDRAEAFSGFVYVIAGPVDSASPLDIRAYCLMDGNFRPIGLVPDPEEPRL